MYRKVYSILGLSQLKWRPQLESNQHLSLRRALFYPLNYGDLMRDTYIIRSSIKYETLILINDVQLLRGKSFIPFKFGGCTEKTDVIGLSFHKQKKP